MESAIFFDLDNTLLDDHKAKENYLPEIYKRYSYLGNISFATFKNNWYQSLKKYIPLCEKGLISFNDQKKLRLQETFETKDINSELIEEFYDEITKEYEKHFTLIDNAISTLNILKQTNKLGLISNGSSIQQWKKINKFNLDSYFTVIIISQDVNIAKPEKKIFELAINECKTNNFHNYYIGDDFENDIKGSFNAGMTPVWYNPEQNNGKDFNGKFYEINNLNMIQQIVNKNGT